MVMKHYILKLGASIAAVERHTHTYSLISCVFRENKKKNIIDIVTGSN